MAPWSNDLGTSIGIVMTLGASAEGDAVDFLGSAEPHGARLGRPAATSQAELSHIAFELFIERGFDDVTIDDIASAAGIGRRTFFRYFPSKNDLPWGEFGELLTRMRRHLESIDTDVPLIDALTAAVIEFNRVPEAEVPYHRRRMELLLNVPTLVAHSALKYQAWREVVADYVAMRLGRPADALEPRAIAHSLLAACLTAYEAWLADEDAELSELLERAVGALQRFFSPG